MTHDPDANCLMPAPDLSTDVFGWLSGEGFVMVGRELYGNPEQLPIVPVCAKYARTADPMPSVADEVRALEGLIG